MHLVDPLFVGESFSTTVWISETAARELAKFAECEDGKRFLKKLQYYAETGFGPHTGGEGSPIRHQGDGVYRIAHKQSLFRLLGFFEPGAEETFLAIDSIKKRGQKLSRAQQQRIDAVKRVKTLRSWRRRVRS